MLQNGPPRACSNRRDLLVLEELLKLPDGEEVEKVLLRLGHERGDVRKTLEAPMELRDLL